MSSLISMPKKNAVSLSISIVLFKPDQDIFFNTLASLKKSLNNAMEQGLIQKTTLYLVDNNPDVETSMQGSAKELISKWPGEIVCLKPGRNLGFGQGHNLTILNNQHQYHLILNPDVFLAVDTISQSIDFMQKNPKCACISPCCHDQYGKKQYLCKTYPSISILLLRGFCPEVITNRFQGTLASYELKNITEQNVMNVTIASGCYMFCKTEAIQQVGGFDPDFFLYFEDFDICLQLVRKWNISYVPQVQIIHHGGHTSRKGIRHIFMFVSSAIRFFSKHGWKI